MTRKLALMAMSVALLWVAPAEAKSKTPKLGQGQPSKYNPKRHSKPKKQKPQFRVKHGKIKH